MNPTVTICVPTFNRSGTLRDTLRAMVEQTFADWELIVGDDASTDDTEAVVREFTDPRIRYCRHAGNLGIYGNWNALIAQARGRYIAIYHDHDIYLPTIVERSVRLLENHPSVQFVHAALFMIDDQNAPVVVDIRPFPEVLPGETLRRALATDWHSPVMAATAMVRANAYARVGPYEFERFGLGCDKEMWFRLAELGDVGYVRDPQALIRARTKTGPTSRFSWQTVDASIRMRATELEQTFPGDTPEGQVFARQRDRMILTLIMRAFLFEPPAVVAEGVELTMRHAGSRCRSVVRLLAAHPGLARLAGWPLLHVHYWAQNRRLAKTRARARQALAAHPGVVPYLDAR